MFAVLAVAVFSLTSLPLSADVVFDFQDDGAGDPTTDRVAALDGGGVGVTVNGFDEDTGTLSELELTTVDIIGQDGSSAASGNPNTAHTTNIAGNQDALGVNTDSTADDGFIGGGDDSTHFNPGESVTFTFNLDIMLTSVEIESLVAGSVFTVSSGAMTVNLGDALNPLSEFSVAAGEEVTFEFVSTPVGGDTSIRIESFQAVIVDSGPTPDPSSVVYDVYIFAGQSNCDGRGLESELPVDSPFRGPQTDVTISYLNPGDGTDASVSSNGFVTFQPGFSVAPGENRSSNGLPNSLTPDGENYFGPAVGFAAAIGQEIGSDNPIAIIKVTRGGTNLRSDWRVGAPAEPGVDTGFLYTALLSHIESSLAELTADGSTANVRGFLWHQGESDRNSSSVYGERFTHLVEGVRAEFGQDIPFVLGELSIDREDDSNENINNAFNALVDGGTVPDLGLVSSEGLLASDGTHFTTDSQIILGQRYAAAIGELSPPILLADINTDGVVSFLDISPLITLITLNRFQLEADVNEDGFVNFFDISPFIFILTNSQGG